MRGPRAVAGMLTRVHDAPCRPTPSHMHGLLLCAFGVAHDARMGLGEAARRADMTVGGTATASKAPICTRARRSGRLRIFSARAVRVMQGGVRGSVRCNRRESGAQVTVCAGGSSTMTGA